MDQRFSHFTEAGSIRTAGSFVASSTAAWIAGAVQASPASVTRRSGLLGGAAGEPGAVGPLAGAVGFSVGAGGGDGLQADRTRRMPVTQATPERRMSATLGPASGAVKIWGADA